MQAGRDIIVIGASAGGVPALSTLVGRLPADFPGTVFIVQHTSPAGKSFLPQILARAGPLPVRQPEHGDPLAPGAIYVAPPDQHMLLEAERIAIVHGPRENRSRPAINVLFRSAAETFGPRVVGVLLTGMLDDGVAGLGAVKRCGGVAVVQEPAEAPFPEMPRAALADVAVDHTLPLAEIAALLGRLARTAATSSAPPLAAGIRLGNDGARMTPGPSASTPSGSARSSAAPNAAARSGKSRRAARRFFAAMSATPSRRACSRRSRAR
jgi:two-component system chemotaxis response regulator CheB